MSDDYRDSPYAVDPSGRYVAVAAARGHGAILDLQSGRTRALCGKPESIDLLSFSPNGKHLVVGRERHFRSENPRHHHQSGYEFEVWNTRDGRTLGNVVAAGGFAGSMRVLWAPDSSAFIWMKDLGGGGLVPIAADSTPSATRSVDSHDSASVVFSADRPLFFLAGSIIDRSGLSLWNLGGEPRGSTEQVNLEWATFVKGGSALVVSLSPDLSFPPAKADRQVQIFDIDAQEKLVKPGKVFDAPAFDWSLLKGATLRADVEAPVLRAAPDQTQQTLPCKSKSTDFKSGVGICTLENAAPVLFDSGSRLAVGELLNWSFGAADSDYLISPDGRTLVLFAYSGRVTAWDLATRTLKWNLPGRPRPDTSFSADGKRLLLPSYIDKPVLIVDADTGATITTLATAGHASVFWFDAAGRQVILKEGAGRQGVRLTLWNVESADKQKALHSLELDSQETAEYAQDLEALRLSPNRETLLEMARRRLRRCD